jgi:oxygen-independent coproporphyrinogen-3 oxidase
MMQPVPSPVLVTSRDRLGLYIHVPFCVRKCRYCSFVSVASSDAALHEAYVEALCKEIAASPSLLGPDASRHSIDTVFFGGGTPSLLTAGQLVRILGTCRDAFAGVGGAFEPRPVQGSGNKAPSRIEVTIEANPGTIDRLKLAALREAGFNRLSLGAQSFDDAALRLLGRIHSARETAEAVDAARRAGFDNVSLDLIFALPGQTLEAWKADLRMAVDLGVEHVSGYMLQLDDETPLAAALRRGEFRLPDDELQKEMLLVAADELGAAGLARYEISNYAKPGFECRHNVKYWTGAPYLGFGPAAHSFMPLQGSDLGARRSPPPKEIAPGLPAEADAGPSQAKAEGGSRIWGLRWANASNVNEYVRRIRAGESLTAMREELTREQRMFETVFLGLRMACGVDLAAFGAAFGEPFDARHGATARRLEGQGLLERSGGFLRLTRKGLPVADSVMAEFSA